jgi:hypothetical protein
MMIYLYVGLYVCHPNPNSCLCLIGSYGANAMKLTNVQTKKGISTMSNKQTTYDLTDGMC